MKPETQRTINAINILIETKKVDHVYHLSQIIKFSQPTIQKVIGGKREAPLSLKFKLIKFFEVNPEYLFENKLPVFAPVYKIKELQNEISRLRGQVEILKELLKAK